jgi:hypothetical protein
MAAKNLDADVIQDAVDAVARYGSISAASRALDLPRQTLQSRLAHAPGHNIQPRKPDFEVAELPSEMLPTTELVKQRKARYDRLHEARVARKLIDVQIKLDGPIGIVHFGDPHVDDDGCDIGRLEADMQTIKKTPGMFGANVGDLQNNWIGRIAHLWAQQSTNSREAWALVEWMVHYLDWLYMVGGNHDAWSGNGDPLDWIMRQQPGVFGYNGTRLNLCFPNGKQVRVNARHDFAGHSMWNPAHGPMKAVQGGWRDHILTCGHKHTSFIGGPLKDPASGLLSWAIRVAGYKIHDRYADEKGLPDQNAFSSCVTVIDPRFDDDDPRLVTAIPSVDEGAAFVKWKRGRK